MGQARLVGASFNLWDCAVLLAGTAGKQAPGGQGQGLLAFVSPIDARQGTYFSLGQHVVSTRDQALMVLLAQEGKDYLAMWS